MKLTVKSLSYVLILFLLSNCNAQSDCVELYNKYVNNDFEENSKKALEYLNRAIECDPDNSDYRFEKVRFYILNKNYDMALKSAKNLNDRALENLMKGIILLKLDKKDEGIENLKSALKFYDNSKSSDEELMFSTEFNIIILKNIIESKNSAISFLHLKRKDYSKDYQINSFNHLEELINANSAENVLFSIYNIELENR